MPMLLDHRIDLNRIDMAHPEMQGVGDVVAGTGADDQHSS